MGDTNNQALEVRKSNQLVEASYKLTLQEQRIILFMASMINAWDCDFQPYRVKIKDFASITNIKDTGLYTEIREITKRLLSRVLVIHDLETNRELQIGWLSSAEYYHDLGYVELCFDPKLKPYLLQLKQRFTRYQITNVVRLRSAYAIRIYELLKQYESVGTRRILLDKLRSMLGIEKDQYKKYNDFKKKVLLAAQKELDSAADLSFDFQEEKEGTKVTGLLFVIKKTELDSNRIPKDLIELLPSRNRKNKSLLESISEAFFKHGPEYVERNIRYSNANSNRNYPKYLKDALEQDWGAQEQDTPVERQLHMREIASREEARREKDRNDPALIEKAEKYLKGLSSDQKRILWEEATGTFKTSSEIAEAKAGFRNQEVRQAMRNLAIDKRLWEQRVDE